MTADLSGLTLVGGMLRGWGIPYSKLGDTFPEDCSKLVRTRMKSIPEEFYKCAGGDVVTPDNFELFYSVHVQWMENTTSRSSMISRNNGQAADARLFVLIAAIYR